MVFADVLLDVGVVSLALMPAVYGVALGGSSQYRTALNVNYSILIRIVYWALRTSPLSGQATTDFMPSFSSPCLPLKGSVGWSGAIGEYPFRLFMAVSTS